MCVVFVRPPCRTFKSCIYSAKFCTYEERRGIFRGKRSEKRKKILTSLQERENLLHDGQLYACIIFSPFTLFTDSMSNSLSVAATYVDVVLENKQNFFFFFEKFYFAYFFRRPSRWVCNEIFLILINKLIF